MKPTLAVNGKTLNINVTSQVILSEMKQML